MQHSPRFLRLINESKGDIKECSAQELKSWIETKNPYLIDVREACEWATGHIPTAYYIGKGVIERDIEQYIADTQAQIIVYCRGGYRSILAAYALQKMGYTNIYSLEQGIQGWISMDYPLSDAENE